MTRLHLNFRLPVETLERLDAIVEASRSRGEYFPANRTDALIQAVDRLHEQDVKPKRRKKASE